MSVNTATEMSSKKSDEETTEELVVSKSIPPIHAENELSGKVLVMLPVFRFLQLLCENRNRDLQNLVLELKNNASKLLLAVMESRILYNMNPRQLVDVACRAYHQKAVQEEEEEDGPASPKEVGHNIYILCHQLAQHNKDLGGRHV